MLSPTGYMMTWFLYMGLSLWSGVQMSRPENIQTQSWMKLYQPESSFSNYSIQRYLSLSLANAWSNYSTGWIFYFQMYLWFLKHGLKARSWLANFVHLWGLSLSRLAICFLLVYLLYSVHLWFDVITFSHVAFVIYHVICYLHSPDMLGLVPIFSNRKK